jgi:hypothetical protein
MREAVLGKAFDYALRDFDTYPQLSQMEPHDVLGYDQTLVSEAVNDSKHFFRTLDSI